MKRDKIFNYVALTLVLIGGFIYFSSLIGISELLYPQRVDSTYVKNQKLEYLQSIGSTADTSHNEAFVYLPSQLGLKYSNFDITSFDKSSIKSWFIPAMESNSSNTIILIHDLNESRISMLPLARQFHDRGFNLILPDLRAHGESDGWKFTFGNYEVKDMLLLLDSLHKSLPTKNFAVLGIGTGAGIALQMIVNDPRIRCAVLQSIPSKPSLYIENYALHKWGPLKPLLYRNMHHQFQTKLGYKIDSINYCKLAHLLSLPTMFIAGTNDMEVSIKQTYAVFDTCVSPKKYFWPVLGAEHHTLITLAGEDYFNKVAIFIVGAMPKPLKKSRFKRLV